MLGQYTFLLRKHCREFSLNSSGDLKVLNLLLFASSLNEPNNENKLIENDEMMHDAEPSIPDKEGEKYSKG